MNTMSVKILKKLITISLPLFLVTSCKMQFSQDATPSNEVSFETQTTTPILFTLFNEKQARVLVQSEPYSFTCENQILTFHYDNKKFEQILSTDTEILFYPAGDGKVTIYANNQDITNTGIEDQVKDEKDLTEDSDTLTDLTDKTDDKTVDEKIKDINDLTKKDDKKTDKIL